VASFTTGDTGKVESTKQEGENRYAACLVILFVTLWTNDTLETTESLYEVGG
jgi:hypothetical protein